MNVTRLIIRSSKCVAKGNLRCATRGMSSTTGTKNDHLENARDPAPVFFNSKVQALLRDMTAPNLEKIFEPKKMQKEMSTPKYQFMTTEELEKALSDSKLAAEEKLQMPPVLSPRRDITKTLSNDSALKGYDEDKASYIFTDITFGVKDCDRLIVKRDPDGVLSHANWEDRDIVNQVYFPFPGRKWKTPKMFEPEFMEDLLKREEFIFILDRACLQFEPNHPDYIKLTQKTYEYISEIMAFEKLRSTRHFGPMAFHLAWSKQIDNLVIECLQKERLDDALKAVELFHLVHPDSKSKSLLQNSADHLEILKCYAAEDSKKRGPLELSIQSYEELQHSKESMKEKIESLHRG